MQRYKKADLITSPIFCPHFLELIILFDSTSGKAPYVFWKYQYPVNIHSLEVSELSSSLIPEELLLEDGDDSRSTFSELL